MSDKIEDFVKTKIDIFTSRTEMEHVKAEFKKFANLPKNIQTYQQTDGWKLLISNRVKEQTPSSFLLKLKTTSEEDFWESTLKMSETKDTTAVSACFSNIIKQSHEPAFALEHLYNFQENITLMLKRRLSDLNPFENFIKNNANRDEFRKTLFDSVTKGLSDEFMDAVGGQYLLTTQWQLHYPDKDVMVASASEKAQFLDSYCRAKRLKLKVPIKAEFHTVGEKKEPPKGGKPKDPNSNNQKNKKDRNTGNGEKKPKRKTEEPEKSEQPATKKVKWTGEPCSICVKNGKVELAKYHSLENCFDNPKGKNYKSKK